MQTAFMEEINNSTSSLNTLKLELEAFYSQLPPDDEKLRADEALQSSYNEFMARGDVVLSNGMATMKSVRQAIVSGLMTVLSEL